MRQVQIYINDQIIDLFDDENIEISSSVQNINDIAKVFTDFSQQFTVPASPRNNEVFRYYYQNDVEDGFIAKTRQPARIEINYTPFRRGKIQLEGAELNDGQVQHYVITFYGDVVTLKDLFGDDKLRDLDYNINFEYTYANVRDSITSTALEDVRFPLISSERVWTYNDGSGIDLSAYAINYTELQPAVRVAKVIEAIENTYGVTFTGNFLEDNKFKKLYTWFKSQDEPFYTKIAEELEFNVGGNKPLKDSVAYLEYQTLADIEAQDPLADIGTLISGIHNIRVNIIEATESETYYLDIYKNGVIYNTLTGTGSEVFSITAANNIPGLNDSYTFKLRAVNNGVTFDGVISTRLTYFYLDSLSTFQSSEIDYVENITTFVSSSSLDFTLLAPDMLVSEYFSGVLRMFNLTCYPTDELTFQVEPLEFWYSIGEEIDITQYTDVTKIKVDRPKLYDNIEFNWVESKAFLNEAYKDINNRQYGTLRNYFGYDGGDFKIDLPFETLLFQKFDNVDLQVSYSLETQPDYKPYIPAPVMLYLYDVKECSFFLTDGVTPEEIVSYMPFGQEIYYNSADYSINFNEEISSLTLEPVYNSLYNTYYRAYLQNLFADKTRLVTVETNLPLRLLNSIQLNDALIIRDKKYRINLMKSQLTTGKVTLELITDIVTQPRTVPPLVPSVPIGGDEIAVPIKPIKPIFEGTWSVLPGGSYPWISTSPAILVKRSEDTIVKFTVDPNGTGNDRTAYYSVVFYDKDNNIYKTEPYIINQDGTQGFLLTESSGYLLQENIDKIRL